LGDASVVFGRALFARGRIPVIEIISSLSHARSKPGDAPELIQIGNEMNSWMEEQRIKWFSRCMLL
jgi:hypothetical protein